MAKRPHLTLLLLRKIFVTASIRRWNDQATPVNFYELDKQAHKFVIAYFLAHYEALEQACQIDWERLILQFCYEFFLRMILTDIKPPVFSQLQKRHNKELVDFVCDQLRDDLEGFGFFEEMREYLYGHLDNKEKRILKAAHDYASKWEFDLIYHFHPALFDVQNIKKSIDEALQEHYDLAGMKQLMLFLESRELIGMFGQLRFQKRWSQTPRIPETSVLGHTLVVAMCAFLLGRDIGFCQNTQILHFLCGIFHDLPEILTRDIISPIKRSVKGLDLFIKEIEHEAIKQSILSKVPPIIQDDIIYFTQDEFANRYKQDGQIILSQAKEQELLRLYNHDQFAFVCGDFLKYCDHLSAFLEARFSIEHGISSQDLITGAQNLARQYEHKIFCGIDLGVFFRDFRI